MLDVIKEADLFQSLLKIYELFPYNDIVLRHVTSIIAYALEPTLAAKTLNKPATNRELNNHRILNLEPINNAATQENSKDRDDVDNAETIG